MINWSQSLFYSVDFSSVFATGSSVAAAGSSVAAAGSSVAAAGSSVVVSGSFELSPPQLEKINEGWQGHPNLKVLKAVDNKFKNLAPFKNMPKLIELYLA